MPASQDRTHVAGGLVGQNIISIPVTIVSARRDAVRLKLNVEAGGRIVLRVFRNVRSLHAKDKAIRVASPIVLPVSGKT